MDYGPILIIVVLVIGIGMMLLVRGKNKGKTNHNRSNSKANAMMLSLNKNQFRDQWAIIEQKMSQPGVDQTKSAMMEADKLLDIALRQSGFRGESMGERLKSARDHFGNNAVYQGMWEAHKMRNALAHEIGFELPKQTAQHYLAQFKAGLQYLKML